MPNPFAAPPNFETPEAAIAYAVALLVVRLGLVLLGALVIMRVSALVIGRLEHTIRARGEGDPTSRENRARTLGGILRGIARNAVIVIALLMGVRELGLDITPAVAAAGGFGVAAGLGAQSLVKDWISGFFIIHDNQYVVGDSVKIAGVSGNVETLGIRHTELRDANGSVHFIPNGEIKLVTNLTKAWTAPIVRIPISLTEEPSRAIGILEAYLTEVKDDATIGPLLREPPKVLGIGRIRGGQYTVLLQALTAPEHREMVGRALRLGAMRHLSAAGVLLHVPGVATQ